MKTILLDIGNSTLEWTVFSNGTFSKTHQKNTALFLENPNSFDTYFSKYPLCISSVVPKADVLLKKKYPKAKFISYKNIPHLTLNLKNPNQVGADRIVNALGATYGTQKPTLIIDSGTATTFCFVDKKGVYQGGSIFPGMGICSKALNDYTAKLPLIWVSKQTQLFGKNTKEAVECGLYNGFKALLNGVIADFRQKYKGLHVVGTGQGLELFKDELHLDHYDPLLIFKGLALCIPQPK